MSWIRQDGDDAILRIRVQPRASRDEIAGPLGDELKIRLQAPPVDGKANKALLRFLAKQLGIGAGRLSIDSGASSRSKRLRIVGCPADDAVRRLGA